VTRDWSAARAKVEAEMVCRVCLVHGALDAAHIVPRSRIGAGLGGEDPRNIVPLCRFHHAEYDQGTLDLLPYLTRDEQAYAVVLVGLYEAYRRTTNERLAA
jgi:5-methylcytosine-specific restriction endonuclease McrA